MIKILTVDDHPIVQQGLENVFSVTKDFKIIDKASNKTQAMDKLLNNDFDIVLLDITMPDGSGLEILKKIKEEKPQTKVIILSVHTEKQYAVNALRNGASAYIPKMSDPNILIDAVKKVSHGAKYISPIVAQTLADYLEEEETKLPHEDLSEREFQVMKLLASGQNVTKIANTLFISEKTVRTYKSRLMKKLNVNNDSQLTLYAINNHLICH